MSDRDQYMTPVQVGDVMRGLTVGVVEESMSDRFAPGDYVTPADGGWQRYVVAMVPPPAESAAGLVFPSPRTCPFSE